MAIARFAVALVLFAWSIPAHADWHVAVSRHFIVYNEVSGDSARDGAVRLEKFHTVLRFLSGTTAPESAVKVKVFMVSDAATVQELLPFGGGGVSGFYQVSIRGPAAVMSRTDVRGSRGSRGEIYVADQKADRILLHELTHHFSNQYFPAAYPTWYSEGFAEFLGTMDIGDDDIVTVGQAASDRYASFRNNDWLSVRKLLVAHGYRDVGAGVHLLYSEGWLLVHYLTIASKRPGQLKAYLVAVNRGIAWDKAATEAFGDLDRLDAELKSYAARGSINVIKLPFKKLDPGPIEVRALSPPENAMLAFDMRLSAGIAARDAANFARRAAETADRFPDDPYAIGIKYEAARIAGQTAAAAQAARQWLAVAPNDGLAISAQADVDIAALAAAGDRDPAKWAAVRRRYAEAARKSPDEPRILHAFYQSYRAQGVRPPDAAQNALYRAHELLPQDDGLRQEVAADFEMRGMIAEAISVIRPAAIESADLSGLSDAEKRKREADRARYRLAGDEQGSETPREMLARLEAKKATALEAAASGEVTATPPPQR